MDGGSVPPYFLVLSADGNFSLDVGFGVLACFFSVGWMSFSWGDQKKMMSLSSFLLGWWLGWQMRIFWVGRFC